MKADEFYVIKELMDLSKNVDENVEREIPNLSLIDACFEELTNTIFQLLNNNIPVKSPKFPSGKRNIVNKFNLKNYSEPLLDTRVHIHKKRKKINEKDISAKNGCSTINISFSDKNHSNISEVSDDVYSSNINSNNKENNIDDTVKQQFDVNTQRDSEDFKTQSKTEFNNTQDMFNNNHILPSHSVDKNLNREVLKVKKNECFNKILVFNAIVKKEKHNDGRESNIPFSPKILENSKIYTFPSDERDTRAGVNDMHEESIPYKNPRPRSEFLDKTYDTFPNHICDTTYIISSEENDNNSVVSKNFFKQPKCKNVKFASDTNTHNQMSKSLINTTIEDKLVTELRNAEVLPTEIININDPLKNVSDVVYLLNKDSSKKFKSNFQSHTSTFSYTRKILPDIFGENSNHKNSPSNLLNTLKDISNSYRLSSLENKTRENEEPSKNLKECKELSSGYFSFSEFYNQADLQDKTKAGPRSYEIESKFLGTKPSKKMFASAITTKSTKNKENEILLSNSRKKQFSVKNNLIKKESRQENVTRFRNCEKGAKLPPEVNGKATTGKNSALEKKFPKKLRTESGPEYRRRKKSNNKAFRPDTPKKFFSNRNQQPLKVKAEQKRKLREMREQKTKERRVRLEKEREERIRVSEQRLKQRFQQHEKMMKKKIEMFKIKSRCRQHSGAKRSVVSCSSKDSKEEAQADNEDFCRNAKGSGQKLSKESNGYHDVSPEEVNLISVEGNVGDSPKVSKKQNAILVGCKKTPAECLESCNRTGIEEGGKISVKDGDTGKTDSEKSTFKFYKSQRILPKTRAPIKNLKLSNLERANRVIPKPKSDVKLNIKSLKRCLIEEKQKILKSTNTRISKIISLKNAIQNADANIEGSYFLRSVEKSKLKNNGEKKNKTVLKYNEIVKRKSLKTGIIDQHSPSEIVSPTPVKETKDHSRMCLNLQYFKANKSAKKCTTPANRMSHELNTNSMLTRSKKHLLRSSSARSPVEMFHNISKIKQKVSSYEISDVTDDSFEEARFKQKKIPMWATEECLQQALVRQYYKQPNIEEIFGVSSKKAVDLTDIFSNDKPEYHKRTSSDKWSPT